VIVRTLQEVLDTPNDVRAATWASRRLLVAVDGLPFSLHDTIVHAGTETRMQYRHHVEAVYCIEGEGELEECDRGTVHPIGPGTVYCLNSNDRHVLRARTRLRLVCVFSPALAGPERHDSDGGYAPPGMGR
jgi:L-ectoine synthase